MTATDFIAKYDKVQQSSMDWSKLVGIVVLDPDGWDRSNFKEDFEKPISLLQFIRKAHHSTTSLNNLYHDLCQQLLKH